VAIVNPIMPIVMKFSLLPVLGEWVRNNLAINPNGRRWIIAEISQTKSELCENSMSCSVEIVAAYMK